MCKTFIQVINFSMFTGLTLLVTQVHAQDVDPYTLDLYTTYCKACHTVKATGAPQAFVPKDWQERLQKGNAAVINNAIIGIGNMPAQGGCQECSYEDYEALIELMSSKKSHE